MVCGRALELSNALPETLTLGTWRLAGSDLAKTLTDTLVIATLSTALAMALTLGCLEAEQRYHLQMGRQAQIMLYLPLWCRRSPFCRGFRCWRCIWSCGGSLASVTATHLVFVLPYAFLSLATPYRRFDPQIALIGASLGASDTRIFWRLRLPMLLAPLLTASAVGIAVSVGQYLPSLLIGGGRGNPSPPKQWRWPPAATGASSALMVLRKCCGPLPDLCWRWQCQRWYFSNRRGLLPEGKDCSSGLCLQDLVLLLHGQTLIELNVNIAPGEVLTVMGPSGSGKSPFWLQSSARCQ